MMPPFLRAWRKRHELAQWERALEERLAARKALRPQRQAAARKGWENRA